MDELEQGVVVEETPADDLRSALAESQKEAEVPTEKVVERPAEGSTERARHPDGTFAPKEASAIPAEKVAVEPASDGKAKPSPEAAQTETPAQAPAAASAVEVPHHWSAADKQWLAGIPAEHQGSVVSRFKQMEAGYTPKLQRLASYERDYQGVPEIFAPHAEALRQQGKTPAHIIQSWAGVEQALMTAKSAAERGQSDENGAAIIARMIQNYAINPADVARMLTNGVTQPAVPARTAVPPELMEKLNRLEERDQQRELERQHSSVSAAQQQIDAFVGEKDAEGNPKHPFFAELEQDIGAIAQLDRQMGKTPNLSELYERAVWANPQTREKLLSLQKETEAKRAAVERKANAEAAKRASVSVTGGPGAASQSLRQGTNNAASVADDLRSSMEELRA